MYDLLVYVGGLPQSVRDYLMPSERVVHSVRQHPLVILWPVTATVAAFIAALALTTGATSSSDLHNLIWLLFGILFLWTCWKIADWRLTYFVITENRLMLATGVFNKSIGMMPLTKVTDMRLDQTTLGRMFRYAEFIVESAGQDQALSRVRYVPYPKPLYQEILRLIFKPPPPAPPPPPSSGGTPPSPWPGGSGGSGGSGPWARPADDPGF